MKKLIILLLVITASKGAIAAPGYVHVPDMSKVHYQMVGDGKVYFRNLNAFHSEATGCCYAFALDTTTAYGKSAWSLIMMKMASHAPLSVYVSDLNPPTSGKPATVGQLGNW